MFLFELQQLLTGAWHWAWLIIPGVILYVFGAGFTAGKIRRWQHSNPRGWAYDSDDAIERTWGGIVWPITAIVVYVIAPPVRGLIRVGKTGYKLGLDEQRPTLTRGTPVLGKSLVHRG